MKVTAKSSKHEVLKTFPMKNYIELLLDHLMVAMRFAEIRND